MNTCAAAGKTHAELLALEAGITERLDAGEAGDPEYWAAVLRRLTLHKARARLRELHARLLERHLQRVVLAGDGVDVAEAMGWEAERQARHALAFSCMCFACSAFSLQRGPPKLEPRRHGRGRGHVLGCRAAARHCNSHVHAIACVLWCLL